MSKEDIKERQKFDPINNADSQHQRQSSKRKIRGKDNDNVQLDGEMIKQLLGLEDDEPKDISDKSPLKMMDIVYQTWGVIEPGEETEDEPEDKEEEDEGMA